MSKRDTGKKICAGMWRRKVVSQADDRKGFTLIELLMVIVIIGMLFGLLTVAFSRSRRAAQRRKAESDVHTLALAIYNYRHEYDKWPGPEDQYTGVHRYDDSTSHKEIIEDLSSDSSSGYNPRQVRFVNWDEYKLEDDAIVDPWGGAYTIIIDCENDSVTVTNSTVQKGQTY